MEDELHGVLCFKKFENEISKFKNYPKDMAV
jgi:hypothetical protein